MLCAKLKMLAPRDLQMNFAFELEHHFTITVIIII